MAECMACTSSYGVTVAKNDGSTLNGYLAWNDFAYEELAQLPALAHFVSAQGWGSGRPDNNIAFSRWTAMLNKLLSDRAPVPTSIQSLKLYKTLVRIRFPVERYVAVSDQIETILAADIKTVEPNAELPLKADMTGISDIALADARRLASQPPRYTVEAEGDLGTTLFAVYGASVSPKELLWHIARSRQGYASLDLKVNGAPLFGFRGPGPYKSVDDALADTVSDRERTQFKEFAGEYEQFEQVKKETLADCNTQRSTMANRWRKMAKEDPEHEKLKGELNIVLKKCQQLGKEVLDRYSKSLGSTQELSQLGVVQFSYAWD